MYNGKASSSWTAVTHAEDHHARQPTSQNYGQGDVQIVLSSCRTDVSALAGPASAPWLCSSRSLSSDTAGYLTWLGAIASFELLTAVAGQTAAMKQKHAANQSIYEALYHRPLTIVLAATDGNFQGCIMENYHIQ